MPYLTTFSNVYSVSPPTCENHPDKRSRPFKSWLVNWQINKGGWVRGVRTSIHTKYFSYVTVHSTLPYVLDFGTCGLWVSYSEPQTQKSHGWVLDRWRDMLKTGRNRLDLSVRSSTLVVPIIFRFINMLDFSLISYSTLVVPSYWLYFWSVLW